MELSNKEKKRRQHEKELNSFRNKMGINLTWFDSLPKEKQYSILFSWKRQKYFKKNMTEPEIKKIKMYRRIRLVKIYPPKSKHYIKMIRKNRRYKSSVGDLRQAAINLILNTKNK